MPLQTNSYSSRWKIRPFSKNDRVTKIHLRVSLAGLRPAIILSSVLAARNCGELLGYRNNRQNPQLSKGLSIKPSLSRRNPEPSLIQAAEIPSHLWTCHITKVNHFWGNHGFFSSTTIALYRLESRGGLESLGEWPFTTSVWWIFPQHIH